MLIGYSFELYIELVYCLGVPCHRLRKGPLNRYEQRPWLEEACLRTNRPLYGPFTFNLECIALGSRPCSPPPMCSWFRRAPRHTGSVRSCTRGADVSWLVEHSNNNESPEQQRIVSGVMPWSRPLKQHEVTHQLKQHHPVGGWALWEADFFTWSRPCYVASQRNPVWRLVGARSLGFPVTGRPSRKQTYDGQSGYPSLLKGLRMS